MKRNFLNSKNFEKIFIHQKNKNNSNNNNNNNLISKMKKTKMIIYWITKNNKN